MSTATSILDMTPKTYSSFHRSKNDSGELDVFEASRYYSGQNGLWLGTNVPPPPPRTRRMSLDEHVKRSSSSLYLPQGQLGKPSSNGYNENRHKHELRQPRSPGGRLASFLNSLFNQSNSRKKKSNTSGSGSMLQPSGNQHADPDERRRRRSSISHFRSSVTSSATESHPKSRTSKGNNIHPSVTTPTKSYKDLRSFLDRAKVEASRKPIASMRDKMKIGPSSIVKETRSELKSLENEKVNVVSGLDFYTKFNNNNNRGSNECTLVDEGEESDSSSDLFELQIGSGGYCSSGLPGYETTQVERIKTGGAPINAPS